MRTSRTARKLVAGVATAVVSLVLVGGTAAAISNDDAGRGIVQTTSYSAGRGIKG